MLRPDRRPDRLDRLALPERRPTLGASVEEIDRRLAATPRAAGGMDLTHGDPVAFLPPDWALAEFSAAVKRGDGAYTPYRGNPAVLAALAGTVGGLLGLELAGDRDLIVTPGSQAGLFSALSALVGPGDVVLLPDPDYFASERILRYLGAEVVPIPVLVDADGDGSLDLDAMTAALLRRPSLLLFSHPNNPTGCTYGPDVLDRVAEFAVEHDLVVVADQLYCRLVYDGEPFEHLVSRPGMRERCVTLLGPSKTESMSGYRLGVAVAPPLVVDRMEQVLGVASLRTAGYNQHLLRRWMVDDARWLAERTVQHEELRELVVNTLGSIEGVTVTRPRGSSYAFPDVSALGRSDVEVATLLRRDAGILVNPGYQFGRRGDGHFRMNFSQDRARLATSLETIREILADLARSA